MISIAYDTVPRKYSSHWKKKILNCPGKKRTYQLALAHRRVTTGEEKSVSHSRRGKEGAQATGGSGDLQRASSPAVTLSGNDTRGSSCLPRRSDGGGGNSPMGASASPVEGSKSSLARSPTWYRSEARARCENGLT
jgi:hypothetical protein